MKMSDERFRIEPMTTRGKPVSDTMPRRGKVTDLCKAWLVHEDGALAYQLQQEEVREHYNGNKSRNAIVREDFPRALDAQREAEKEAEAEYHQRVAQLEERDARIARDIAAKLQYEEEERRKRRVVEDQFLARTVLEKERKTKMRGDVNAVGLPPSESGSSKTRSKLDRDRVEERLRRMHLTDEYDAIWPAPPDTEQMSRAHQEKSDEELAKRLQMEEQTSGLDMVDRDRLLAIEVQDMELARMLQEKEKARLKRAKEKAKAKAQAKKMDELKVEPSPPPQVAPPILNIATAIDPTYSPSKSPKVVPQRSSPVHYQDHILYVDPAEDSPPYMPVQGQKREKKKKKDADCKQQ